MLTSLRSLSQRLPSSLRQGLKRYPLAIHLYRLLKVVWLEPLNQGRRLRYLRNYLWWYLWAQPRGQRQVVNFENGLSTWVYADSDSGVSLLFTRNVDYYDDRYIRSQLRQGDFIVDAGCNVGNRTLALADLLGGALLLDANPLCLQRLEENFSLNQLPLARFERVAKAVGAEAGELSFTDFGGTHCSNQLIEAGTAAGQPVRRVPVTTIDAELARLGNPPCRFIKLDLEGHDLAGLQGCEQTLRGRQVELVKFERWRSNPLQGFLDFFAALDWVVFGLDAAGHPSQAESLLQTNSNLFAMPRQRWQASAVVRDNSGMTTDRPN